MTLLSIMRPRRSTVSISHRTCCASLRSVQSVRHTLGRQQVLLERKGRNGRRFDLIYRWRNYLCSCRLKETHQGQMLPELGLAALYIDSQPRQVWPITSSAPSIAMMAVLAKQLKR